MAAAKENTIYSGNRYVYDMKQADSMRSSGRRVRDDRRQMETNLEGALRGLEEAESQRNQGNTKLALDLYTRHLETLVVLLRDEDGLRRIQVDPSTVKARVSVALADAEELKAQSPPPQKAQSPNSQSSIVSGTISSVKSAFLGRSSKATVSAADTSPTALPTKQQSPQPLNAKSQSSSALLATRKGNNKHTSAKNLGTTKSLRPTSEVNHQSPTSAAQSRLKLTDPVKKQLYTAVLDDLYVDPKTVQETGWDDIAGLGDVKQSLQESAILPLVRPDLFTGLRKPQNILLWG